MKINQTELKRAYSLVINDLFANLCKLKNGKSLCLNQIGTFTKTPSQMVSGLDNQAYVFYKMGFRMSQTLKRALDSQLKC